jgi:hypothetical protein
MSGRARAQTMRATRRFAAPSTFMPTSRGDSSIRWRVRRAKSAEPIAPPATTPITDGRSARPRDGQLSLQTSATSGGHPTAPLVYA